MSGRRPTVEEPLPRGIATVLASIPTTARDAFGSLNKIVSAGFRTARYHRPLLTTQVVGETEFKLWAQAGHPTAQRIYGGLAKKKAVYEEIMVECLRQILDAFPAPVFMDVGAFMGYYACYVATYRNDRVPVYALESNPDYCATIRRSIAENGFQKVALLDAVLSDQTEILYVVKETVSREKVPGAKAIRAVTFDELCEERGIVPTVLKVDVHGAEGKVLAGARRALRESARFVLLELHPDDDLEKYSPGYTRHDVLTLLEETGFKNHLIGGFRDKRSPERRAFHDTGKVQFVEITKDNRDVIFFDRNIDLFIFSVRDFDIQEIPCFS